MSKDKRTASQRIEDLERAMMGLYQTADNMARDLMMLKDAVKLLGNKVDAIVTASERGNPVSNAQITEIMIENNVAELKEKVDTLIGQGILTPTEEVNENSFIVGRDLDADGTVVNPRIQITFSAINPEAKEKVKGAKAGQVLDFGEGKNKFEVLEVYNIGSPEASEVPAEAAPEVASS